MTSSEGKTPIKQKGTADSPVATSIEENTAEPKRKGYTQEEIEALQRSFAKATLEPADMSGTATIATTITGTQQMASGSGVQQGGGRSGPPPQGQAPAGGGGGTGPPGG